MRRVLGLWWYTFLLVVSCVAFYASHRAGNLQDTVYWGICTATAAVLCGHVWNDHA